jgi:hypothetical protein
MPSKDEPYITGDRKKSRQDQSSNGCDGEAQQSSHGWSERFEIRI